MQPESPGSLESGKAAVKNNLRLVNGTVLGVITSALDMTNQDMPHIVDTDVVT